MDLIAQFQLAYGKTNKGLLLTSVMHLIALNDLIKNLRFYLVPEAFSNNDHNFSAATIERHSNNLGIEMVWKKLSRQVALQSFLRITTEAFVEEVAKKRLDGIIEKRNHIIHRGRSYAAPSESEVKEAAGYLKILIGSMAEVFNAHLEAL